MGRGSFGRSPASLGKAFFTLRKPKYLIPILGICLLLNVFLLVLVLQFPNTLHDGVLYAFPGAQGFGADTPGGRYGRIIFVTNLNDTTDVNSPGYKGSLRWALEHTWADDPANSYDQRRIIIFKIGGAIRLSEPLVVLHPFTTIAGQSAPGDGIMLQQDSLIIAAHDVIVRGIRVRVGDEGEPSCCRDGITITTDIASENVYNVVIDHSSVSWAIDENISSWSDPNRPFSVHDVTIQWNIISEGLQYSIHVDEGSETPDPHSMGLLLGHNGYNMSVHHNLFAHNEGRNPFISGIRSAEIVNNVIYDWHYAGVDFSEDENIVHVLNNYFIAGGDSHRREIFIHTLLGSRVFAEGNITDDQRDSEDTFDARIVAPDGYVPDASMMFTPSQITVDTAGNAFTAVLEYAGATAPIRDSIDARVVSDVRNKTGGIIDSQNEVGGWQSYDSGFYPDDRDGDGMPNEWEIIHGTDPAFAGDASSFTIRAPSGYTWIEEYLNSLIQMK